ncbi:hypothetical protein [Gimesia sp.]|uniref:hypothetical protein n=1 Tax=Gimesia sp. TaxID=2024833 RepID=UPI003A94EDC5
MPETIFRRTPIQHLLEPLKPVWLPDSQLPIVLRYRSREQEQAAMQKLGLCDLSGLSRLGLKGAAAASWLSEQGLPVPEQVYALEHLSDGGLIVRLGTVEFLLESSLLDLVVPQLDTLLTSRGNQLIRVERQDASILLVGSHAHEVLVQTCGVNFREVSNHTWVFTRLAGVSCGILSYSCQGFPAYRLWFDCSYAVYLWKTLCEIVSELEGMVIGVETLNEPE